MGSPRSLADSPVVTTITGLTTVTQGTVTTTFTFMLTTVPATTTTTTNTYSYPGKTITTVITSYYGNTATVITSLSTALGATGTNTQTFTIQPITFSATTETFTFGGKTETLTTTYVSTVSSGGTTSTSSSSSSSSSSSTSTSSSAISGGGAPGLSTYWPLIALALVILGIGGFYVIRSRGPYGPPTKPPDDSGTPPPLSPPSSVTPQKDCSKLKAAYEDALRGFEHAQHGQRELFEDVSRKPSPLTKEVEKITHESFLLYRAQLKAAEAAYAECLGVDVSELHTPYT